MRLRDESIAGPVQLRTLLRRLKDAVAAGELGKVWPSDKPFASDLRIVDVDMGGP